MATPSLPTIPLDIDDFKKLIIFLNSHIEEVDWLFGGKVDTKNIREIAGWLVSTNLLQSKDKDVGFSTEDTEADDVRMWAGDVRTGKPNFTVTKSGKMTATGGKFQSSHAEYPRVELDATTTGNIFKASKSATEYIAIDPDYAGSPALLFESPNSKSFITPNEVAGTTVFNAVIGDIQIGSQSGEVQISSSRVEFFNWSSIYNRDTGKTLKQDLDSMSAPVITPGTYSVTTFSADGRATSGRSLTASDIPTGIAQSKITNLTTDLAAKASKTLPSWSTITLSGGWVTFNSETPSYYKDDLSRVYLRGRISSGTAADNTLIATLPAGYRPGAKQVFSITSKNATALVNTELVIDTNGEVRIFFAANTYLNLNGVSFRAEL